MRRDYTADPCKNATGDAFRQLAQRLESTTSPQQYMDMLKAYHNGLVQGSVKTASQPDISDICMFEIMWGFEYGPQELLDRYNEGRSRSVALSDLVQMGVDTTALVTTDGVSLDALWSALSPHGFFRALKDYHWSMWRGEIPRPDALFGLVKFEKMLGLPLQHDEIVEAYKKAHYNLTKTIVDGDDALSKEFGKPRTFLMVDADWENYWGDYLKKGDIPTFWYVMTTHDLNDKLYQGAALVRKGKVIYYDRYPMGGGPFKVKDFKDEDFRRRAEIIAEHVERAVQEGLKPLALPVPV